MSGTFKKFTLGIKPVLKNNFLKKEERREQTLQTKVEFVSVYSIKQNPYQPRKVFNKEKLQELMHSIQSNGLIQPVLVRKQGEGDFQLIAGERRLEACKLSGLTEIPVLVKDISEEAMLEQALIENIQREDLNPIEEGLAYEKLLQQSKQSHEELAKRVGKARTTITNAIRLLALTDTVKTFLQEKKIEMGHARALLSISEEDQDLFANRIIEKKLTVRETEALVQAYRNSSQKKPTQKENPYKQEINKWIQGFEKALSTAVSIKLNKKGEGSVTIPVSSPDEIKWLLKVLSEKT